MAPFRRGRARGGSCGLSRDPERLPPPALSGSGSKGASQPVCRRTPLSLIALFFAENGAPVTPKMTIARPTRRRVSFTKGGQPTIFASSRPTSSLATLLWASDAAVLMMYLSARKVFTLPACGAKTVSESSATACPAVRCCGPFAPSRRTRHSHRRSSWRYRATGARPAVADQMQADRLLQQELRHACLVDILVSLSPSVTHALPCRDRPPDPGSEPRRSVLLSNHPSGSRRYPAACRFR